MGAMVGKVAMNRNCPPELSETVEQMVEGYEALIAEFNQPDDLVRPIITPRFIPSCTPEMLQACGDLAAKYQLPVQSHLSENLSEMALVQTPLWTLRTDTHHHGPLCLDGWSRTGTDETKRCDGRPLSYV